MKKIFSKIGGICLGALFTASCLLPLSACKKENGKEEGKENVEGSFTYEAKAEDVTVWSAPASQKIMADQPVSYYEEVKREGVALSAVKNEYETGQIIVTADEKDVEYVVSVSDLVHTSNSSAVISKENCNIYTQYYLSITKNLHRNGAPLGEYPDAIVPQKNAIEHDLNFIKKGQNGGAWLEFFIPKDAVAGNYKGTATVDLGKGKVEVPISLKVYDVTLADETTSKSFFTINTSMVKTYELDSSIEMYDKYAELLIKHRLSPTGVMDERVNEEDKYVDFANRAYSLYEKGMSTVSLPVMGATTDGYATFDPVVTKKSVIELVKKSLEKQVDLVARAAMYNYIIDEPFGGYLTMATVDANINLFDKTIAELAEEVVEIEGMDSELGQKILESVQKIPHVVTDFVDNTRRNFPAGGWEEDFYEGKNVTLCCPFDGYDTQAQRDLYEALPTEEKWFYGCNMPFYPYPSYHIDDTLVSTAAVGWMMADYGITGNLYWVVNYYRAVGSTTMVEEPYKLADTNVGSNGEGTIIYPGKPFGVDGPIGSIRLSAILDGNEDYELIKALKKAYADAGVSADKVLQRMTATLYTDVTVNGGAAEYEEARETLLALLEVASSKGQMMITDVAEAEDAVGMKNYSFTVKVAEGTQLYEGETLLEKSGDGYVITKKLTEDSNYLTLKAVKDGETATMSLYLGGKQQIYTSNDLVATDFVGSSVSASKGDGKWTFAFTGDGARTLTLKHSSLAGIGEKTASYILETYVSAAVDYTVYVKYSKFGKVELSSGKLTAGDGQIVLDSWILTNWKKNGVVEEITLEFHSPVTVDLKKIKIYGV